MITEDSEVVVYNDTTINDYNDTYYGNESSGESNTNVLLVTNYDSRNYQYKNSTNVNNPIVKVAGIVATIIIIIVTLKALFE